MAATVFAYEQIAEGTWVLSTDPRLLVGHPGWEVRDKELDMRPDLALTIRPLEASFLGILYMAVTCVENMDEDGVPLRELVKYPGLDRKHHLLSAHGARWVVRETFREKELAQALFIMKEAKPAALRPSQRDDCDWWEDSLHDLLERSPTPTERAQHLLMLLHAGIDDLSYWRYLAEVEATRLQEKRCQPK